jgi:hypothetical protein
MQSLTLLVIFVLTAISLQAIGFGISRMVDYQYPAFGLMTFLILFIGAFFLAWPIALRIAEWLIRRAGYIVETEQSGGDRRRDHLPAKKRAPGKMPAGQ